MTVVAPYKLMAFESEHFAAPVWRLQQLEYAKEVRCRAQDEGVALISFRETNSSEISEKILLRAGFRPVEILVRFQRKMQGGHRWPGAVRFATVADSDACAALARQAIKDDRFHRDPEIGDDIAGRLKAAWVKNSIAGRSDQVFCALEGEEITGFNACLIQGDAVFIDLIAVAAKHQKHGHGTRLVQAMVAYYGGRFEYIRLGTQLDNERAINFYRRNGFDEIGRSRTWHWTPSHAG